MLGYPNIHHFILRNGLQVIIFHKLIESFSGDRQRLGDSNVHRIEFSLDRKIVPQKGRDKGQASALATKRTGSNFEKVGIQIKGTGIKVYDYPLLSSHPPRPDNRYEVLAVAFNTGKVVISDGPHP